MTPRTNRNRRHNDIERNTKMRLAQAEAESKKKRLMEEKVASELQLEVVKVLRQHWENIQLPREMHKVCSAIIGVIQPKLTREKVTEVLHALKQKFPRWLAIEECDYNRHFGRTRVDSMRLLMPGAFDNMRKSLVTQLGEYEASIATLKQQIARSSFSLMRQPLDFSAAGKL